MAIKNVSVRSADVAKIAIDRISDSDIDLSISLVADIYRAENGNDKYAKSHSFTEAVVANVSHCLAELEP